MKGVKIMAIGIIILLIGSFLVSLEALGIIRFIGVWSFLIIIIGIGISIWGSLLHMDNIVESQEVKE